MASTDRPKVCIDRLLPTETHRFQSTVRRGGSLRAILVASKMWMNGSTLRVRFLGGTAEQRAKVREQAGWWSAHANLKFDFNDAPDAEIRIAFDPNDGAWSYIGTDNRSIPFNQPTMNLGFMDGGTTAHEFGHAIGLGHEHQNPAGGIQWNEPVVLQSLAGPPNNWDESTIRHNVLRKYSVDQIRGTQFDPKSIMLYFFPASWTTNGIGTRANEEMSAMDKAFIASAQAYPKTAPTVDDAVELTVDARRRTRASIGKPGEEDLFRFRVDNGGRYIIDTQGPTDVVMKLFGPDSKTDVIAEDDDSGVRLNARIAGALVEGEYFVQIRHYSRARTGEYSIRVRSA
ncbi:M12 family metallopeptidase [Piscinibacter sakaiensis]|uniref:M12 family metallopeptidase n=1 Tax=Piscinibacter sakaiensis TaxID=1547922 RepID=UPI003AAD08DA